MQTVSQIMTTAVEVIPPGDTLYHAAQLMDQLNVGSLPVCESRHLLGIVTDRDIAVRGIAAGLPPDKTFVADIMTKDVTCCTDDLDIEVVRRIMCTAQVRRVPVIDRDRQVIGIVSLSDMATRDTGPVDDLVREISTPSAPDGGDDNS